ncbi:MAG TPA: MFS transporter [Candidatus Limnocylindrales bacterium]|nr:MFS transporter [Candidatus Limnocylindrales bacterium]
MSGAVASQDATGAIDDGVGSRLLVATVFSIYAIAVANTTSGAVAQPAIAAAFGAGTGDVGWVVFGYSAAFAVMTAVYGSLARRFGLVPCLTAGVALVASGALVATLAPSLPLVIAARVLQGTGAGAIPTLTMALIARRMTGPARARALGINVAAVGVGFASGPLVGGLLLEVFGWRGAMALGMLVAPAALLVWRFDPDRGRRDAGLDLPGIGLLALAVLALVFVVNRLPVLGPAPIVVAMALVAVGAGAVLHGHLARAERPVVPLGMLHDRGLLGLMVLGFAGQAAFLGAVVVVPVAAARGEGVGGTMLGLVLVPMAVVIALLSPRNGLLVARVGRRTTTGIAHLVIAAGTLFLGVAGPDAPLPVLSFGLVVAGVGFAFLNAPLVGDVARRFGGEERSIALGIYNLAFFLGSATGAAVSTALVQAAWELPWFGERALPGWSSGLVVLAAAPLALGLIALLVDRRDRGRERLRGAIA